LSGSQFKAPGFAGGYLLWLGKYSSVRPESEIGQMSWLKFAFLVFVILFLAELVVEALEYIAKRSQRKIE
jgi:hypothetical protein